MHGVFRGSWEETTMIDHVVVGAGVKQRLWHQPKIISIIESSIHPAMDAPW